MTTQFQSLLAQHVASSMLKQLRLSEFLGQHNWDVDLVRGEVSFGPGRAFAIQVMGTESQGSGTWLWGWANEASHIPPQLLRCASTLRELGQREGIEELSLPEINLGDIDGHALAMVASGLCGSSAYYRGPYDGGALFFTVHGVPLPEGAASPLEAINTMNAAIMQYPLDHGLMVRSFLGQQGFQVIEQERSLLATAPGGSQITINLDAQGRIAGMETTLTQETTPPAKKPWWKMG
jgi:hypothetical protein